MKRVVGTGLLVAGLICGFAGMAVAGKGDRATSFHRVSPLLEKKVLDLRFADFAQGIWTRNSSACEDLYTVDRSTRGDVVAIFRGLLETPARICSVYGAEQGAKEAQRAALNCHLVSGGEALGLVTVRSRGSEGLMLQDGERPPQYFRFCRAIPPVMQTVGQ